MCSMLDTNVKGNVAELEIAAAAARLGIPVLKPVTEHARCDLAFEIGSRLWRVQCKWGRLASDGDVVIVRTCGSRHAPRGYVRTAYSEGEVDLFAVYCDALDRCFLLSDAVVAGRYEVHLRLKPPRNFQQACINLADNFDFEGAIAQLGERVNGIHEVAGSSPASSTGSDLSPTVVGANPFRDKLGYWMDRAASGEHILITRRGRPRICLTPVSRPSAG